MVRLSSRERANLIISIVAGVVLVAAVLMEMWLTAAAQLLLIIASLGTFYGSRRASRF